MGGTESSRRVTVEGTDDPGMVKISDDVVKRLRGLPEPSVAPSKTITDESSMPTDDLVSAAETKRLREDYNRRLKELEQKNVELYEDRLHEFAEAVSSVEKKFVTQTSSPICADLEQAVLRCYQDNPDKTLLCSGVVKQFMECVENSRKKLLNT